MSLQIGLPFCVELSGGSLLPNLNVLRTIITHNAAILSALHVDAVHVLVKGRIAAEGGQELIDRIAAEGFASFEEEDA